MKIEKGEWVEMGVPGCLAMKRTLSQEMAGKIMLILIPDTLVRNMKVEVEDNWEGREVVRKILD